VGLKDAAHLGLVLLTLARALVVRITLLGRAGVVPFGRGVLYRPARGMLVGMAGMLDQLLLRLLEPLGLPLAGLLQWALRVLGLTGSWVLGARRAAYASGVGGSQIGLL